MLQQVTNIWDILHDSVTNGRKKGKKEFIVHFAQFIVYGLRIANGENL